MGLRPDYASTDALTSCHLLSISTRTKMDIKAGNISNAGVLASANTYHPAPDLWIVTSYYNPCAYKIKLNNYETFIGKLRSSNLNWLVVECAFDNVSFAISSSPNVIHVRAKHIMWQKERLINLALEHLPDDCAKVAWIDCDILFTNPDWAVQTSQLLDHYSIVQPFDNIIRLPQGKKYYEGEGDQWKSFAAVYARQPNEMLSGRFDKHGHTGFAWATRRDILARHGLYDACISGSRDHMM